MSQESTDEVPERFGHDTPVPPASGGTRVLWNALPASLRTAVESALGSSVVAETSAAGGFSPGLASRLTLTSGERVFVKAMGETPSPIGPQILRREARVLSALGRSAPVPQLEHVIESDDWVALVLEDVEGRSPRQPWDQAELGQVLSAMTALAATLTPASVPAPSAAEHWQDDFSGWRQLAAGDRSAVAGLSPWAGDQIDLLARWESSWTLAAQGQTLLHGDVRADNVLLTAGGVVFVDWPWACIGAPWVDLVLMLPSVAMQGGGDPETIVATHPLTRAVEPDAITSVLAAVTGFFIFGSLQPPPPGLPRLRAFQRAQGVVGLKWLRERLDGLGTATR